MKLSLLVLTPGKQEGKILEIKLPQFLIGRDPQCQLRPASPLISKRHCAIIQRDGKAFIRDFGSTNGTFVNDEPIQGECELHHDDQLKIGPIQFTVRMETAPAHAVTPAPATKPTAGKTPAPATIPATASKQAASKSDTPLPATAASSDPSSDDDIAAMLLELDDGSTPTSSSTGDPVPDGSTVFDLQVPPPGETSGAPGDKNKGPAKPAMGDTRSAAARILEKMTKRPRT
jgi:predicted component of type VI protein secretion system